MTDGFTCRVPKGTVLVTFRDSLAGDSFFSCSPEDTEYFRQYVPEDIRKSPKFAGLSMVFRKKEIGDTLQKV